MSELEDNHAHLVELNELLGHHRVACNVVVELLLLFRRRQLAIKQQIAALHKVAGTAWRRICQLLD